MSFRLYRMLLNANAGDGGGGAETKTETNPATVTITQAELDAFKAGLAERDTFRSAKDAAEREAREIKIAKDFADGNGKLALDGLRTELTRDVEQHKSKAGEWEKRAKNHALESQVMAELAGRPLNPGAARQIFKLVREDFQVEADGDGFKVQTVGLKGVKAHLDAVLGDKEYSHFLATQNKGGSGAGGADKTATTGDEPKAGSLAWVAAQQAKNQSRYAGFGPAPK